MNFGTVLLVLAVVLFALLTFQVIDTHVQQWEWAAFGVGFASLLPWAGWHR